MGKRSRRPRPQHNAGYADLCARLKELREAAGLTQVELGRVFRRPHTFVHKVETGGRRIDPVEFCHWCHACGANPADEIRQVATQAKRTGPR